MITAQRLDRDRHAGRDPGRIARQHVDDHLERAQVTELDEPPPTCTGPALSRSTRPRIGAVTAR